MTHTSDDILKIVHDHSRFDRDRDAECDETYRRIVAERTQRFWQDEPKKEQG